MRQVTLRHRFLPAGASLWMPYDPHWNELGHRPYGEALAEALDASGLPGPAQSAEENVAGPAGD